MRSDQDRLLDMLDSIEAIKRHTQQGRTVLDDEVVGTAVMRWIETLGEAASRLTSDLREAHPDIPWAGVIGMRNRLVHCYFEIDTDRVWAAIEHELPPLEAALRGLLNKSPE